MKNNISSNDFRKHLGNFATGVVVVTAIDKNGDKSGITINSFSSVSLDPQLISFSIDKKASNYNFFVNSKEFVVNILSIEQKEVSQQFAKPAALNWEKIDFEVSNEFISIENCLISIACSDFANHDGGDHTIILGKVEKILSYNEGEPLLYYQGDYAELAK